jgi:hypothetical protein
MVNCRITANENHMMKGGFIWLEGGGRIHRISELQRFIIALGLEDVSAWI